ncbi:DNA damage-binding protein CMR1 [Golovinomyces cichoracearum]|uniref:DNA damage-binding protein CMR1 n=1 Tax=Golovinomyces cichoracearum TaxID=62708 RepID=A0A420J6Y8_9PEZI|nr:DNA damage-binding protein CMR1 [Golovinomyces cichoracearum]
MRARMQSPPSTRDVARVFRNSGQSDVYNFGQLLLRFGDYSNVPNFSEMALIKKEMAEMSAFERKRLENIAANQAMLKDLGTSAAKIITKPVQRPKKKATSNRQTVKPIIKGEARQTRSSSRIAGIEPNSEAAKRKAEIEYEFAKEQARAKRQRVTGELKFTDMIVDGKRYSKDINFLSGVVRGAQPYVRTFVDTDIPETTNESLKKLREKMRKLKLYEAYDPTQIKITPERIYSLCFHPSPDKPLIFAGDKEGNVGIFDASQKCLSSKAEDSEKEMEEEEETTHEPIITALKIHSKTITSMIFSADGNILYSASYDSSVRKFDLQKEVAIEAFAPSDIDEDLPISCIDISSKDQNLLYFSTLNGSFGFHDLRTRSDTEIWQLGEKKFGGFSLHPQQPHLVATASLDRTLKIWDLRNIKGTGEEKAPALMGEHESRLSVSHASWSISGHIATSSYDDTIKIYPLTNAGTFKIGHELDEEAMKPSAIVKHNNQTGRWVTILKPHWQQNPQDGIPRFVIGNMNRFVDVYCADGEQLAQLGGDGITAVPAVTQFHPTQDWIAGGTASGKLCLWM